MRNCQVTSDKFRAHKGRNLVKPSSQKDLKATVTLISPTNNAQTEFPAPICFGHIL